MDIQDTVTELDTWNDMECIQVPDGYDMRSVPDVTRGNIEALMNKVNELVQEVNELKGGK